MTPEIELLVVGAGPAGLAAAAEATAAGVRTTLVDAGATTGGQYYARPAGGAWNEGLPPMLIAGMREELLDLRLGTAVWGAFGADVALVADGRSELVRPAAMVLATGAVERPLPLPGWDAPNVVTPGAMQRLLKVSGAIPDGRVVVAGSGPFLLAVAADLRAAGADVAAVVEQQSRRRLAALLPTIARSGDHRREALRFLRRLRGVETRFGVGVAGIDGDGLILADGGRLAAETICLGHGFAPRLELARLLGLTATPDGVTVGPSLETSLAGVFAAGETTGIGGALVAAAEGRVAGLGAARHLGKATAVDLGHARRLGERRDHQEAVYRRLDRAYAAPHVLGRATPETTICRCEGVTLGDLRAIGERPFPADDPRAVKAELRCGMGPCQGAMCAAAVQAAVAPARGLDPVRLPHVRPPLTPISVATVANASSAKDEEY
jgi:NADPH-dependent 2,4-dienoyl-CoA reductase/sulfur reductase-like enzyme